MGAAAGDYDGDGRIDLFVTGWRDQRLYRNLGNCRFEDVTERARLEIKPLEHVRRICRSRRRRRPRPLRRELSRLRREIRSILLGAGRPARLLRSRKISPRNPIGSTATTAMARSPTSLLAAGINPPEGRGLGVLIAELTGDNRPDIYVANDGTPCWLFANQGDLRFKEIGETAGVARDGQGQAIAGMGVGAADLDDDGLCELVVTNFFNRSTIAFQRLPDHRATLSRRHRRVGARGSHSPCARLRPGAGRFRRRRPQRLDPGQRARSGPCAAGVPFAMRPTLLRNTAAAFRTSLDRAGTWFDAADSGRGLAVGDLDGDNRPDVVVNALDAPPPCCETSPKTIISWLWRSSIKPGRPAVGARVQVTARGCQRVAVVTAGGSYLASAPARLVFGLGSAASVQRIDVTWPWGKFRIAGASRRCPVVVPCTIKQGSGRGKP